MDQRCLLRFCRTDLQRYTAISETWVAFVVPCWWHKQHIFDTSHLSGWHKRTCSLFFLWFLLIRDVLLLYYYEAIVTCLPSCLLVSIVIYSHSVGLVSTLCCRRYSNLNMARNILTQVFLTYYCLKNVSIPIVFCSIRVVQDLHIVSLRERALLVASRHFPQCSSPRRFPSIV